MLYPNKIVLHCSATKDTPAKSWEAIRRYHMEEKGWNDIGYHYGIEIVGNDIMVYRGRPWWIKGSHCVADGRNHDSLGVCVVGKFDDEPPSHEIYTATLGVLRVLCGVFWIDPSDVYGHREFEDMKTCPGKRWDLGLLRDDLRRVVPPAEEGAGAKIGEMP